MSQTENSANEMHAYVTSLQNIFHTVYLDKKKCSCKMYINCLYRAFMREQALGTAPLNTIVAMSGMYFSLLQPKYFFLSHFAFTPFIE